MKLTASVCVNKVCNPGPVISCNLENGETTIRPRGKSNSFFAFDFVMLCKKTVLVALF
jgi:hypothetical protein